MRILTNESSNVKSNDEFGFADLDNLQESFIRIRIGVNLEIFTYENRTWDHCGFWQMVALMAKLMTDSDSSTSITSRKVPSELGLDLI